MEQRCTLGVDVGTSSTKGVLVTEDGRVLASAVRDHEVSRPAPGRVEMDPEIWWDEFVSIARELTARADEGGAAARIAAVGVSGMGPCVVLTGADGRAVRPAILYGVDTRAGEQIVRLERELGAADIVARGGSRLTSQAAGPKIAWVRDDEPDAYARARRLHMPASWLAARLTDAYVLDHHSASQCWPLYDLAASAWHGPWWDHVAPGIEQPRLLWSDEIAGTVGPEAAAETGIPEGTPVTAGTIDAWSEAVSVGAQSPGDLMLMYGTTMFLVATTPAPVRADAMWTTVGAFRGTTSLAGGMATSGAITGWWRDILRPGSGGDGYAELVAEAEASGPGAGGLVLLPYFAGERTPVQDPDARGVLAGLTLSHTRGDLYRATLEAVAFGVRHNVETLRAAGAPIERAVAVGGGTRGSLWTQIVSDVTGMPQDVPEITVGASYGAAHLAARAVAPGGEAPDIAAWNPVAERRIPDAAAAERYDRLYRIYRRLHESTADLQHELAAIQAEEVAR